MPKSKKIYFSIGEVASLFNVNTSLIRFWEKEFDIIKPHKSEKGTRYFTRKDIDNFHLIYNLVKEKKYTIEGAKEHLAKNSLQAEENFQTIKTLKEVRSLLVSLRETLDSK